MLHVLLVLALAAPTTAELVDLGESLAKRGDGKKAIPHLEKALADPAIDAKARTRAERALGLALLEEKKPADAIAHLENATQADASDEKTWQWLGMAYDGAQQYPNAIAAYKRAVLALPKSSSLKHELGMALLEAGNAKDAADVLSAASKLAPGDPEIHIDAAYALVVAGDYKAARDQAADAVSLAGQDADAFYNLGLAESGLGNVKAAQQALTHAVDIDDMHVPALVQLGFLALKTNDAGAGVKYFSRVLQMDGDHDRARQGLTASLAKLSVDDPKLEAIVTTAAKADPKNPAVLALQGELALKKNNVPQAISKYEAALKAKPDDAKLKARLEELKALKKK